MKPLRIATFTRGSTNKQTNKGKAKKMAQSKKISARDNVIDDDLPLQKEMIKQFIESQPEYGKGIQWVITDLEYIEAGVSGFHTHVSKRKGLNQAFEDAKAGLYDILVIYKLDRFGRRSVESLNHAIKFLKYCRIWVVDKNREFTNNGDADEIMNFIEFWSAKKSSMDTKIRVTDAMKLIHKDGYWTGGNAPYGYINHPEIANMLQIVPEEAETVKDIFYMYTVDGYGMLKIAGILNEQCKKTKLGKEWRADNIRKILRNSIYKGYLSYGKTRMVDGEFGSYQKYLKQGEESISERYWSEYDLVGQDMWEKAQTIKVSRTNSDNMFGKKTPTRSRTGKGLLVGVLKCECGSNMTYGSSSNWLDSKRTKKGEPYGIYRCLKRVKSGVAACGATKGIYKSAELEEIVVNSIKDYIQKMITTDLVNDIKKQALQATKEVGDKLEIAKLDVERWYMAKENANKELMKILMGEKSVFNQSQLTELYEKATSELEKAHRTHAELEAVMKNESATELDISKLNYLLNSWKDFFDRAKTEEKRQMIRSIVKEVTLDGEEVTVKIHLELVLFFESISSVRARVTEEEAAVSRCDSCQYESDNKENNSSALPLQYNDYRSTDCSGCCHTGKRYYGYDAV